MKNLFRKEWWMLACVRACKTIAQTAIGIIGTNILITDVNWIIVLSSSLLSGLISLLTSIQGLPELENATHLGEEGDD
ncbi:hypothetical protein M2475_000922 [Breznakia sp. PF5-3]|uniref:holin n=1 Tax=unclassified Breznakia TaxID=2623764 RepID=UPI002404916D|nr:MULTISPECIES: holin [unclassified Breznakia]MDF9824694.1 hypothetical protein [Breznakia sp. PM6-1]MDF9835357.1 hypothetical protein [Breznakia sp. PF5-3]MDF9836956.1 hypothetical protein [Breznakia sp. PFB2-8]MDF9859592.1 hypothetical protein [Breznakia sp. PH5-24]